MSGLKIAVSSFHRRVLNLNLLRLFYFLKKEYNMQISHIINKKTHYKLFNVLKSPVQYKVARNQLTIVKHKLFIFLNLQFIGKSRVLKNSGILCHIIQNLKANIISSNCI